MWPTSFLKYGKYGTRTASHQLTVLSNHKKFCFASLPCHYHCLRHLQSHRNLEALLLSRIFLKIYLQTKFDCWAFFKQIMSNRFSAITKRVADLFVKDIHQNAGFTRIHLLWIDTFLLDLEWNSCLIHSKICFVLRVACAPSKAVSPMPPGLGPW